MSSLGTIQTGIGLTTGMDIGGTVDSLIEIASKPRDNAQKKLEDLQAEQIAITELSAMLVSCQYLTNNLGKETVYGKRSVTSSDTDSLTTAVAGTPAVGSYKFTPLQSVQNHQYFSGGFTEKDEALGTGSLTVRFGENVTRSVMLSELNGGEGFSRGKMRITDQSGTSAVIDLSTAITVDDVLDAINENDTINVTAEALGDSFRLTDNTGLSISNLKVVEVAGGQTAASLGLDSIDTADDSAEGLDVVRLYEQMLLDELNDGSGVRFDWVLEDIQYELRDGTTGTIDLGDSSESSTTPETLGELLDAINAVDPDKLHIEIAADGDRLVVQDLTTGSGTTALTSLGDSGVLSDLGLEGAAAVDGTVTGSKLLGGMGTVLLSSLGGGSGIGELGELEITDRSGAAATVDLSSAETLQDVIDAISEAGIAVTAQVNAAKNGIEVVDTSGSYGTLTITDSDGKDSAAKLGLTIDSAAVSVDSGDLKFQVVSEGTKLDSLNGGQGVDLGTIHITDSEGTVHTVIFDDEVETIGEVVRAINAETTSVSAEINESGDGIVLTDNTSGAGTMTVVDIGSGTTAADLNLLGSAESVDVDGEMKMQIDGRMTRTIEIDDEDTLETLKDKINELGIGISAEIFADGSKKPYRLSFTSEQAGKSGEMLIDISQAGFSLFETVEARDARLVFGGGESAVDGIVVTSSSNKFDGIIEGAVLTVQKSSTDPVTVTVERSSVDLVATIETFVTNYNKFRELLDDYTEYDLLAQNHSILAGDATARRFEEDMSRVLTQRFFGSGSVDSISQLGIEIGTEGSLTFKKDKFENLYEADPEGVESFFTTEEIGFSAIVTDTIEQLAGVEGSLWSSRDGSLSRQIIQKEERVEFLNEKLEFQRERMLLDFYYMEQAISQIQSTMTSINSIQYIGANGDTG